MKNANINSIIDVSSMNGVNNISGVSDKGLIGRSSIPELTGVLPRNWALAEELLLALIKRGMLKSCLSGGFREVLIVQLRKSLTAYTKAALGVIEEAHRREMGDGRICGGDEEAGSGDCGTEYKYAK